MLKRTALLLATCSVFQSAYAANDIPITVCSDLQTMSADLSAHYYLTQDIDCEGVALAPVPGVFKGQLTGLSEDGARYTISNMTVKAAHGNPGGLFTKTNGARIADIDFFDVSVLSDDDTHRGLLAADMDMTQIENVNITHLFVGGDTTADSFHPASLNGREGGLAGTAAGSHVINVHLVHVQIKQHTWAGGMFGKAYAVTIKKSSVAGLSSFWDWQRMEPYPEDMIFGGLMGYANFAVISESSAEGAVSSPSMAGGLIGAAEEATITNSYAQVHLFASNAYVGGLIGRSFADTTFEHVYAVGRVEASEYGRGMIGSDNPHGDSLTNVEEGYFDKDVSKREHPGDSGSKARSTKRMTKEHEKTFAADKGWSRDIWVFVDGEYPTLK